MDPYVIVGACLAGAKAAETLRAEGFDGRVVLIGDETELPYERPPLSKGYLLGKDPREKAVVHDGRVVRRARRRAAARHAGQRDRTRPSTTVELAGGERLRYDKLLLATGSLARPLDVPGGDPGAHYLRTLPDADALADALQRGGQVVVVGAGWIGLEVAAAAREYGAEVTVVESTRPPLRRVLGDEVGDGLRRPAPRRTGSTSGSDSGVQRDRRRTAWSGRDRRRHRAAGRPGGGRRRHPAGHPAGRRGRAGRRQRRRGRRVAADLRPGHLRRRRRGLVATRCSAGVRVEHWANALNGGPAAARSMLGQDVTYDRVPYFFSDQYDLGMEYSGWAPPGAYDQVVFRGDLRRPGVPRLLAVAAGGCWPA